ncbi:hypothetical protein [Bacteroides gallinarum]|uniref:hypothetical protein n=1 Tax=Bacteroides gallinarum TaxID=376806 RepID=UPI0003A410DC|nr:hypothetical protein [Bacteroides gallinarum]
MKEEDRGTSSHGGTFRKGCVLAFFSVVASYSNLSTYHFSGAKIKVLWEYGAQEVKY